MTDIRAENHKAKRQNYRAAVCEKHGARVGQVVKDTSMHKLSAMFSEHEPFVVAVAGSGFIRHIRRFADVKDGFAETQAGRIFNVIQVHHRNRNTY